ncbi:MAG: polysaccharide deacetylase family protein [Gemmatimonadales bacterium]
MRLASLCYNTLRVAGVTKLARQLASGGVVLCYHNVVATMESGTASQLGLHMPLAAFERQMRWLADHYAVVPLEEVVDRVLRGGSLRGVAAITFDDGYAGVFDHAWPLLQKLGLSATVFVVADAPGRNDGFWWDHPDVLRAQTPARHKRWLTALEGDHVAIVHDVAPTRRPWQPPTWSRPAAWQAIADAAASGLHIGVHSATHRSLPTLTDADLHREVVESRDIIQRRVGVTPMFFAYPYGLWNDRVRRAVQSAGYGAAFTLEADRGVKRTDAWALPRVNVPASIEQAAFEAWAAGLSLRRRHAS